MALVSPDTMKHPDHWKLCHFQKGDSTRLLSGVYVSTLYPGYYYSTSRHPVPSRRILQLKISHTRYLPTVLLISAEAPGLILMFHQKLEYDRPKNAPAQVTVFPRSS